MTLKIFLDDKSFHRLKQSIPRGSLTKLMIAKAVHLEAFGSSAVLSCDEAEAPNLLLYAGVYSFSVAIHRRQPAL